ncbi:amidohydrolase, partial [Klebsiella pneumoniae]|nr:amidohydrolase [Klebsiella pneumoniae]
IPEDMQSEYGVLTTDVKRKILGLNAARLYDIEVPAEMRAAEPPAQRTAVASGTNAEVMSP